MLFHVFFTRTSKGSHVESSVLRSDSPRIRVKIRRSWSHERFHESWKIPIQTTTILYRLGIWCMCIYLRNYIYIYIICVYYPFLLYSCINIKLCTYVYIYISIILSNFIRTPQIKNAQNKVQTSQPRKNTAGYFPLNPGWVIGILRMVYEIIPMGASKNRGGKPPKMDGFFHEKPY